MDGIAGHSIGRKPLYTIIGVCGVALVIVSFCIPVSGPQSLSLIDCILELVTGSSYLGPSMALWVTIFSCIPIIGVVGGIIGLSLHSWKVQVLSGLISLIAPIMFIIIFGKYIQPFYAVVALSGGILLVIAGLMMRTASSSVTHT